jgi:para-aminobenzoate synthetase component I
VIRSIVVEPERVSIGAGGGITALSVPEEELDEVAVKASALIAALGL